MEAGYDSRADELAAPFSALSGVAEKVQETLHSIELERNRIRNEGS